MQLAITWYETPNEYCTELLSTAKCRLWQIFTMVNSPFMLEQCVAQTACLCRPNVCRPCCLSPNHLLPKWFVCQTSTYWLFTVTKKPLVEAALIPSPRPASPSCVQCKRAPILSICSWLADTVACRPRQPSPSSPSVSLASQPRPPPTLLASPSQTLVVLIIVLMSATASWLMMMSTAFCKAPRVTFGVSDATEVLCVFFLTAHKHTQVFWLFLGEPALTSWLLDHEWWFGLVVMAIVTSTKLLYVKPG